MSEIDYYQLLGINPSATVDEIRDAYRKLARRHHPDSNPEWEDDVQANRQMAQLNTAYATLRDPARRAEYDRQRWERLEQRTQRARYYEQAQARTHETPYQRAYQQTQEYVHRWRRSSGEDPFVEPPGGWPQLVFVPSSLGPAVGGGFLLLVSVFIWMALLADSVVLPVILFGSLSFIGGVLLVMAALPYFQGYIVLTQDRLIEYPTFGLWAPREYRYDQICDVQEQVFRHKSSVTYAVTISYFKQDASGRWDVTRYHGRRLMQVRDHYALLHALRVRARARKFPFSKPAWSALLIEQGQLIGMGVAAVLFLIIFILMMVTNTK